MGKCSGWTSLWFRSNITSRGFFGLTNFKREKRDSGEITTVDSSYNVSNNRNELVAWSFHIIREKV